MPLKGPKTPGLKALLTDSDTCPSLFKWPPYNLDNNLKELPYGTFDPDILQELSNYCQRTGKWKEFPQTVPATATAANKIGWIHEVAVFNSSLLLPVMACGMEAQR